MRLCVSAAALLPLLLLISCCRCSGVEAGCPAGWSSLGTSCYYRSTSLETWYNANMYCRAQRALLASVHSAEENGLVAQLAGAYPVWLGLRADSAGGQFAWLDGSSVDFTYWAPDQPADDECVVVRPGTGGQWATEVCMWQFRFVCKMAASQH